MQPALIQMNSKTAKLLNRYAKMKNLLPSAFKKLWNATPSPSRHLARLKMKSHILKTLNESLLKNADQIPGLHQSSERETVDGSRY